jgi:hypothetical protein
VLPLALSGLALVGCEDGPQQTFSPAPANAASIYNNSPDASTSDPGSQQFDASSGGNNAVNICTPAQQTAQWSKAFLEPIVPPFQVGGMDLSVGGTFDDFTIEDAEQGISPVAGVSELELCQGQTGACTDGSGSPGYAWGPSSQLNTCYDVASHDLTFFLMLPGYDGKMTFTLPATFNGVAVPTAVDQNGKPGSLTYVWQIGVGITETNPSDPAEANGVPLKMGFTASGISPAVANKLYVGLMATFQPTLLLPTSGGLNQATDPNFSCLVATTCRTSANPDGSGGNYGVRPVGVYADFALSNSTDANTASSPSDIYMYPVKFEPYSLAPYNEGLDTFVSPNSDPTLKFNGQSIYGPYAPAGVLSPKGRPATPFCTLYMGETFGTFEKNCLDVNSDTGTKGSLDDLSLAKLLGASHHTSELYLFSTVGVNQNFRADTAELTQNGEPSILPDGDGTIKNPPHADDLAANFIVDVRASGAKLNDMRGDQSPATPAVAGNALQAYEDANLGGMDLHGSGAVEGYFRQLVYNDLRAQLTAEGITPPADATTCMFDSQGGAVGAPSNWFPPAGCTGWEQMVTPAMPLANTTGAGNYLPSSILDFNPQNDPIDSIFQPGDPQLTFFADPRYGVGQNEFITAPNLMQAALQQTIAMIGHGNAAAIPSQARDWRYYFQFWAQAFTKYLLNRHVNPTWQQLYADDLATTKTLKQTDQDQLFFDLNNGLDKFEYIDRTVAPQLGFPVDFEYDILITTSNTQDNNFYQYLFRAESGLYQTMLGATADSVVAPTKPATNPQPVISKKTDVPGSNENVNISDLFGAPAIVNARFCQTPSPNVATNGKDGFYCCTTLIAGGPDPDCLIPANPNTGAPANPNGPPTDANGNVLVDGQGRPLFTNYQGVFFGSPYTIGNTLTITSTNPYIASAMVALQNTPNPYAPVDPKANPNTPLNTLVPWLPSAPTNGFEIPINAQRSQFIQTGSLDFSGVTITTNVDYLPQTDANGNLTGGTIAAVETQDFLGEVWPCVASNGDILRVKMYTSTLAIEDWLDAHPGAQTACNIFIRYSPYDNYPDYITSTVNGVLLSVNPGAGGGPGRIADVTLFNPSLLTQTQ